MARPCKLRLRLRAFAGGLLAMIAAPALAEMAISSEARHMGLATRLTAIRVVHSAKIGAKAVLLACPSYRIESFRSLGFKVVMKTNDSFESTTLEPPTILKLDLSFNLRLHAA